MGEERLLDARNVDLQIMYGMHAVFKMDYAILRAGIDWPMLKFLSCNVNLARNMAETPHVSTIPKPIQFWGLWLAFSVWIQV